MGEDQQHEQKMPDVSSPGNLNDGIAAEELGTGVDDRQDHNGQHHKQHRSLQIVSRSRAADQTAAFEVV